MLEESCVGISRENIEKKAIVDFHNTMTDGSKFTCRCHIFFIYEWEGEIKETKEMIKPTWFDFGELPVSEVMPSDPVWLPEILSGKKIIATAYFGSFQKELLNEVQIEYVDGF